MKKVEIRDCPHCGKFQHEIFSDCVQCWKCFCLFAFFVDDVQVVKSFCCNPQAPKVERANASR